MFGAYQMGFHAGKGTNDCLHIIKNCIKQIVNNKEFCIIVYLNLESAFDRVWHKGLLFKLKELGIGR